METIAEKITLDTLDKSTWKTYRFDQIARNISERVEPTQTDLNIYVGLEHIDSDSVHIRRFGKRDDVSGTKLRCYPGDVIFGRRRAYQRKAAVVTFDGFCSAHSLVLRANPGVMLPDLFPFFLHSDTFMHRAVDISVGSLSPTVNWGDLKQQEFRLPPKEQQAQIAKLLWAGDEENEMLNKLLEKISTYKQTYFYNNYQDLAMPKVSFSDMATVNPKGKKDVPKENFLVSFIPMQAVSNKGEIDYLENRDISVVKKGFTYFEEDDILFAKITPCMENGKGAIATGLENKIGFGSTEFYALRPAKKSDLNFLFFLTQMPDFRKMAEQQMVGSAGQKRVQSDFFNNYKLKAPSIENRERIGDIMMLLFNQEKEIEVKAITHNKLQKSLINQFF